MTIDNCPLPQTGQLHSMSAELLITGDQGRVLLLRDAATGQLELPGGALAKEETPRVAAWRLGRGVLGAPVAAGRLLCTHHLSPAPEPVFAMHGAAAPGAAAPAARPHLVMTFEGTLAPQDVVRMAVEPGSGLMVEWRVPVEAATGGHMSATRAAGLLAAYDVAQHTATLGYLEDGQRFS